MPQWMQGDAIPVLLQQSEKINHENFTSNSPKMRIINVKSRFKQTHFIVNHSSSNEIEPMREQKKIERQQNRLQTFAPNKWQLECRCTLRFITNSNRYQTPSMQCKNRNATNFRWHIQYLNRCTDEKTFFSLSFQFTLFWKSLNEKKTETKKRKENVNSCGYPVSKFCFTFDLLVHWILNNKKNSEKHMRMVYVRTSQWCMCRRWILSTQCTIIQHSYDAVT